MKGAFFMFYAQLEKLCKINNTTPTTVALKLGYSKGSMTYWKKGKSPSGDIVLCFANYFNVSTDYLLTGKENNLTNEKQNGETKEPSEQNEATNGDKLKKLEEIIEMQNSKLEAQNSKIDNLTNLLSKFLTQKQDPEFNADNEKRMIV